MINFKNNSYSKIGKKKEKSIKHVVVFVRFDHDECFENFPAACDKLGLDCKIFNVTDGWEIAQDENNIPVIRNKKEVEWSFAEWTPENTIVFPRVFSSVLGLKSEPEIAACKGLDKVLQENNYTCINNFEAATKCSDKSECSLYCTDANLDQPRYIIFTKGLLNKCKDEEGTLVQEKFDEIIKTMYEDWDNEKSEDFTFVVKKPVGSLGIGVTLCKGNELLPTLQLLLDCGISSVLVQEMCKCDDGDLRIHVLNLGGEPKVVTAMKRCKSTKDFRSNYSLGNDTETVELSDNQRRLAIEAAKASELTWTGVDIMHLQEPSIDGFEDVLIEINTSPGLSGITETIGHNVIEDILSEVINKWDENKKPVRCPLVITPKSELTADGAKIKLDLSRINNKTSQLTIPYNYNNYFGEVINIDGRTCNFDGLDISYSYEIDEPTLILGMNDIKKNKINIHLFDK